MTSQILALTVAGSLYLAVQGQQPSARVEIFGAWVLLDSQTDSDELRPPLRLIIDGDADGVSITQFGIGAEQRTGRFSLSPFEMAYPYRRGFIATDRRAQWVGDALVTGSLNGPQTVTYRLDAKGLLVVEMRSTESDRTPEITRYVRDDSSSK